MSHICGGGDHNRYSYLSQSPKTKAKIGGHCIGAPMRNFPLLEKEKY